MLARVNRHPGTEGRPLQIRTNFFPLNIRNGAIVGIYQISGRRIPNSSQEENALFCATITPQELYNLFGQIFNAEFRRPTVRRIALQGPVTNGIVTIFVLPALPTKLMQTGETQSISLAAYSRGEQIGTNQLSVTYLRKVDISDSSVSTDFEDLIQKNATLTLQKLYANEGYKIINKDLYTRVDKQVACNVIDILKGIRVRVSTEVVNNPMMSINMTFLPCLQSNIQLLHVYGALFKHWPLEKFPFHNEILENTTIHGSDLKCFRRLVKGLLITVDHITINREYFRIVDVTEEPASKFYVKGVSLNKFFAKAGFPVSLPLMNAVSIKRGSLKAVVPMEFCWVADTPQRLKFIMDHVKDEIMMKTAIPPRPRFKFIDAVGEKLSAALVSPEAPKSLLKSLGVQLFKPISMEARVIDDPDTVFKTEPSSMAEPYTTKRVKYVFFNLSLPIPDVSPLDVMQKFVIYLRDHNINIDTTDLLHYRAFQADATYPLPLDYLNCDFRQDILDVINKLSRGDLSYDPLTNQLIFFVLLPQPKHYPVEGLKVFCDTAKNLLTPLGYVSQMIKPKTFGRLDKECISFCLSMQINAKLGGLNNVPTEANVRWHALIAGPTMFIGIDTRNCSERRGVVTIAVSNDPSAMKYRFYRRSNFGCSRLSLSWNGIIDDALVHFDGPFPTKIIVMRAGMDENQLVNIEAYNEVTQLQSYIQGWCYNNNKIMPKITYIGYNRSHNARFMRTDDMVEVGVDSVYEGELAYNVPRGTIIDHTITNSSTFYLISHNATQGTVRPSKYYIIADDNNFSNDDIIFMLHTLCFLSPRSCVPGRRPLPITYCQFLLRFTFKSFTDPSELANVPDIPENLRCTPFFI